MIADIKKKFQNRDRVIRILAKNGNFRAVAVKNTEAAKLAQQKHQIDNVSAYFLAKTLAAALMLSAFLKGEERVSVELAGTGIISRVFAEALQVGECRGFVAFSQDYPEAKITTLAEVLGAGTLKISRILYSQVEPIIGVVPLKKGDVSVDLAYYFAQSEQINSAVILDVDFDDAGNITSSGGIIVQAMPGASEAEISEITNALAKITSLKDDFAADFSLEDVLKKYLPFEFDVVKKTQVDFFCRCSKENFVSKLLLLKLEEIKEMKAAGHNELVCQFCNEHYSLNDKDFDEIISKIKARKKLNE